MSILSMIFFPLQIFNWSHPEWIRPWRQAKVKKWRKVRREERREESTRKKGRNPPVCQLRRPPCRRKLCFWTCLPFRPLFCGNRRVCRHLSGNVILRRIIVVRRSSSGMFLHFVYESENSTNPKIVTFPSSLAFLKNLKFRIGVVGGWCSSYPFFSVSPFLVNKLG